MRSGVCSQRRAAPNIAQNPYELHQVLSWHAKWSPVFSNLKYIVIDEAHRYRGVFGSHIAFLLPEPEGLRSLWLFAGVYSLINGHDCESSRICD